MTDPRAAEAKYKAALVLEADLPSAQTGLARIALEQGRLDDALARIAALERRGFLEPEAEKVKAELTLRIQAQQAGGISLEAARAALAASPDDPNLKFQLAEALAAAGQYADALALCLELVERERKGDRRKGPPDHDRDLPAPASRLRARHRISAAALAGTGGVTMSSFELSVPQMAARPAMLVY